MKFIEARPIATLTLPMQLYLEFRSHNDITYTPESLPIHMVMLRDDGNSGLLLRLTGADDDSFGAC